MTTLLPAIVTVLYLGTSAVHLWKREYCWAMVWFGYSFANIGMILAMRASR